MARSESDHPTKTYKAMDVREGGSAVSDDDMKRGTTRKDTVRKILENGWVDGAVCEGRYTDDYKRDAARNFDKGPVDTEAILEAMDRVSPKHCWVALKEDGRQVLTVYWSYQSYSVVLDTRQVRYEF